MNIYILATLFVGILIGANLTIVILAFLEANHNEDVLDK